MPWLPTAAGLRMLSARITEQSDVCMALEGGVETMFSPAGGTGDLFGKTWSPPSHSPRKVSGNFGYLVPLDKASC